MVSKYHHSGSIAYPCPPIQSQEHSRISSARKVKSVFQIQHGCLGSTLFWDTAMYQGLKTTKQWCCCWLRSPTFLRGINQLGCAAAKSNSMRRKLNLFFFFFPQLHSIYLSVLLCTLFENHPKYLISKQGRPPRNSEKGAVRCCRRAMRGYNSGLYYASESSLVLQ